jgi:hypothetical protein
LISAGEEKKSSLTMDRTPDALQYCRWASPRIANLSVLSYLKVKME